MMCSEYLINYIYIMTKISNNIDSESIYIYIYISFVNRNWLQHQEDHKNGLIEENVQNSSNSDNSKKQVISGSAESLISYFLVV